MISTNMNSESKNPITYKQETIQPKKVQIKLIKKKTWFNVYLNKETEVIG
jgi:hypothetical protein